MMASANQTSQPMSRLKAGQLIYTRVDREQSPRRVGGFQTLFFSHERIPEELVETIEGQLSFDSTGTPNTNLVFVPLGRDHLVLARMTRVDDRDQCGRQGNYVAHALVFLKSEFVEARCDPMSIAKQFRFVSSVPDAVGAGNVETGNIDRASIALGKQANTPSSVLQTWSPEDLTKLLQLAAMAAKLRAMRRSVAINGSRADVERLLQGLCSLLPVELVCELSFCIGESRCTGGRSWAYGPAKRPTHPGDVQIDIEEKAVDALDDSIRLSAYTRWIGESLRKRDINQHRENKEDAWHLCKAIDTEAKPGSFSYDVDEELADEVWNANHDRVQSRLRNMLSQELGPHLGERALGWIVHDLRGNHGFRCLARGLDRMEALAGLYLAYCSCHERPDRRELADLHRICQETREAALVLWLAVWRKDWKHVSDILTFLDDMNYRAAVGDLLQAPGVQPERLYVPGRGRLFAEAIRVGHEALDARYPIRGLVRIVKCLVLGGDGAAAERFIPLLENQSKSTIKRLWSLVERYESRLPESFVRHVEGLALGRPRCRKSPWVTNLDLLERERS